MAVTKAYSDTAHGQIHYRHVAGGGTPLILLHRAPVSSASFEKMLTRIEGRRTAIAFDTPGFGQSFAPTGKPVAADYARWLLAAIDALGIDDFHLVPHHTGTHFATELAVMAPERTRSLMLSGVLYAGPQERAAMRAAIGRAQPIDADGGHMTDLWSLMKGMLAGRPADLIHEEKMGAMSAFAGRDQAFDAILSQDFAALLKKVRCPIHILQACDDPLMPMLQRVRAAHPHITIDLMGSAGIAAPECQPDIYAAAALGFAAACESTSTGAPPRVPASRFRQSYPRWARGAGVFADHVALPAKGVAAIPEGWSFEEGATLSCAGVTAWSALKTVGDIQPDDWVLIIGTGGVALFALQIAVAAGARVMMLSSSDDKRTRAMGATATINYRTTPDWAEAVKETTGGGVQHVVELGGAGTIAQSLASAAIGGHIALIGAMDGFGGDISGIAMIMNVLRVSAVTVGSRADHLALSSFMAENGIKPIIDSIHDVAAAQEAYDRTAAGAFGKVVIRMAG